MVTRRHDPHRRDRIIDAALDVIAAEGVAGTSHRRVAAAADVPLGSMTYHFAGMHELLHAAFTRYATSISDRFEERLGAAVSRDDARRAVVELVTADVFESDRDLVLTTELYTLAAREPEYRDITDAWMARSCVALERHFDPVTAHVLDALIEGLTIHRALRTSPLGDDVVREAVERATANG